MKNFKHNNTTYLSESGTVYHADTCRELVSAVKREKVEFQAFARGTYPGKRLGECTNGLNSIGYWSANDQQDWGLDWHRNEGMEFHFLESGNMPYSTDNIEMELMPGDFTITRPWQAHKVGNPNVGIGRFYWVIIDVGVRRPHEQWVWPDWIILTEADLNKLTLLMRQNERPVWKAIPEIRDCFKQIHRVVQKEDVQEVESKIRIYINELLIHLLALLDTGKMELNESLTDSVRSAKQFLAELTNHLNYPWTIEKMAKSSGMGVTRFTHHCKQITNLTPMQFLTLKRLDLAKKMLKNDLDKTATQIAYECGFASSQYFTTVFKKAEKVTPNEWRDNTEANSEMVA
ncbi:MAG: AraC family transcriptional regulator [Cyclobacteriaceae bacterium]